MLLAGCDALVAYLAPGAYRPEHWAYIRSGTLFKENAAAQVVL